MKRRPRILQQVYAFLWSYFWLPCPICGEDFGGHESAGTLFHSWSGGRSVCPDCVKIADDLNKQFFATNPPPPVTLHS